MKTKQLPCAVLLGNAALIVTLLCAMIPITARAASGTSSTGGGTIYFDYAGWMNTMNSDGANKTSLPLGGYAEPSRMQHGGHRWFLRYEAITGQTYSDGSQRWELFAIRDDGTGRVQLTDLPDLKYFVATSPGRWGVGDGKISWIAASLVNGVATSGGIYAADILFDGSGNIVGLAAQPVTPIVAAVIIDDPSDGGLRPDIRSHDWSPDGARIVYDTFAPQSATPRRLFIATVSTGTSVPLSTSTPASWPVWSPDNSRIAYQRAQFGGGIATITPAGTGEKLIIPPPSQTSVTVPVWSPTGTHILYHTSNLSSGYGQDRNDVYRADANGGKKTNLTKDLNTSSSAFSGTGSLARARGWR